MVSLEKLSPTRMIRPVLLALFVSTLLVTAPGQAKAFSSGLGGSPVDISVSGGDTYATGGSIGISFTGVNSGAWRYVSIGLYMDGVLVSAPNQYFNGSEAPTYGTWYISAPSTPGNHTLGIIGYNSYAYSVGYFTITVVAPPSVSSSFSPSTVAPGGTSNYSWSSTGAVACDITHPAPYNYIGGWPGAPTSYSTGYLNWDAYAPTLPTDVDCYNSFGQHAYSSATLYITNPPPTVSNLVVSSVPYGGTADITFSCNNTIYSQAKMDGADIIYGGTNQQGYYSNGVYHAGPLTSPGTHTVTLYCWNSDWTGTSASYPFTVGAAASCAATTQGNCSLPATSSGSSAGSCSSGYTGACSYSCTNGAWSQSSNSCTISAPTPWITAIPSSIPYGGTTLLQWGQNGTSATSCATSPNWYNGAPCNQTASGNAGPLTSSQTYTFYSTNAGGTGQASVDVTVAPPVSCSATTQGNCSLPATSSGSSAGSCASGYTGACSFSCTNGVWSQSSNSCVQSAPTATLTAAPNPVDYNGRATLTWSSTNATSCTAGGPWSNSGTLSGSGLTDPLTTAATFTFQCTGPGGTSALQSVTVNVNAPSVPAVSCAGAPTDPYINQPVTWSPSVSGGSGSFTYAWSGTDSLSGTSASVQKTYATSGAKQAAVTVTDTVSGQAVPASCNGGSGITVNSCTSALAASPTTVEQGQVPTLTWSVSGGSSCATSCSGSGFSTGGAISGTAPASVAPTPPSTSYALTCTGGTYSSPPPANTTVTVITPAATITVNGQSIPVRVDKNAPNNVSVAWSSTNATSCSIKKNGAAWSSGLNSSGITDSVTAQTTYVVDCVNSHGTHATATAIVNVANSFTEF